MLGGGAGTPEEINLIPNFLAPYNSKQKGMDGECNPASAPEKGLRRVTTGTAKLDSQFGSKGGLRGSRGAGKGAQKRGNAPQSPSPTTRPAGSAGPHRSCTRRRQARHLSGGPAPPRAGARAEADSTAGAGASEPAEPRRRSAHPSPETRSGPLCLRRPLPARRQVPHPRHGLRGAWEPGSLGVLPPPTPRPASTYLQSP